MFWILTGALALVSTLLLVLALMRGQRETGPAEAFDIQIYRDQLAEIERDAARGTIAADEAERLKVEISRRILAADSAAREQSGADAHSHVGTMIMAAAMAVVVLGGGFALYDRLGAPGTRDLPLETRLAQSQEMRDNRISQAEAEASMPASPPVDVPEDYMALVEKLRVAVAENPDDLRGNILLAGSEATLGNHVEAYRIQARVVELRGADVTAKDYTDLADMMIIAAGGYVSPEAQEALEAALALEPENGVARFYGGLMMAQTGRPDVAFQMWDRLLRESPPEAPWVGPIRAQIEELAFMGGVSRYELPPLPQSHDALGGPSAEDMENAAEMSDEDRQAMIRSMVDGLSERLAQDGGTAPEWARLINALTVLGETERALSIYEEAQTAFAGDPDGLAQINSAAQRAGLTD